MFKTVLTCKTDQKKDAYLCFIDFVKDFHRSFDKYINGKRKIDIAHL